MRKNVHDRREIRLEDILKKDYISYLGGRPNRDTVIGKDDFENLLIALNTTTDVTDFIKAV